MNKKRRKRKKLVRNLRRDYRKNKQTEKQNKTTTPTGDKKERGKNREKVYWGNVVVDNCAYVRFYDSASEALIILLDDINYWLSM